MNNQQSGFDDSSGQQAGYEDASGQQGGYSNMSDQQGGFEDSGQQGGYTDTSGQQGVYTDTSGQQGGYTDESGQQNDFNNDSGTMSNANASDNDYSNNDSSNNGYNNNENSSRSGPSGTTGRTGLQAEGEGLGQGFNQGFGQGLAGDSDGSQPHEGVQVQEEVTPDSSSRDTDLVCLPHSCIGAARVSVLLPSLHYCKLPNQVGLGRHQCVIACCMLLEERSAFALGYAPGTDADSTMFTYNSLFSAAHNRQCVVRWRVRDTSAPP